MALLKLGSAGADVLAVKNLLIAKGFDFQPSNQFDAEMDAAVRKFQRENGLDVDGKVGPLTLAKMKEGHPSVQSPAPASARPLDPISVERIKTAHPKLRDELLAIFKEVNNVLTGKAICRLAYVLRTFAEQDALYAQGRNGDRRPQVTNAKGGQSYHNYGLAVDIVLLKDTNGDGTFETASWETSIDFDGDGKADWMEVVAIFQKYGWQWGLINGQGKRYDLPHFQKTFGKSVSQLLALRNSNKTDSEGYVLL